MRNASSMEAPEDDSFHQLAVVRESLRGTSYVVCAVEAVHWTQLLSVDAFVCRGVAPYRGSVHRRPRLLPGGRVLASTHQGNVTTGPCGRPALRGSRCASLGQKVRKCVTVDVWGACVDGDRGTGSFPLYWRVGAHFE